MDALFAPGYDQSWGRVSDSHRDLVGQLARTDASGGLLLDAATATCSR